MKGFYNCLELLSYGDTLILKERSFRLIEKDEILVKIHACPINPSDLMFIKGEYGKLKPDIFPLVPGFEGSGEIVEVGINLNKLLVGKRVGIIANPGKGTFDGLWSEYHYTKLQNVIIYDKPVMYDKICFVINPLTGLGIVDTLKKKKSSSVLITGASGHLGRILIKLCARENISMVCLVKNNDQEKYLKNLGAQNIIKLNDNSCWMQLTKTCFLLNVKDCFDCLGGDYTGKLLFCLPKGSVLHHFGNLEKNNLGNIRSADLIFYDKEIRGWWLNNWFKKLSTDELDYWLGYLRSEIQTNSDLFRTKVHEMYDLEEVDMAISDYLKDMSKGKIILTPFRENSTSSES
jgi:NADPH:quinone reductase-like Zn-dependent oxidoreductase